MGIGRIGPHCWLLVRYRLNCRVADLAFGIFHEDDSKVSGARFRSLLFYPYWNPPKNTVVYLVGKLHRFVNRIACRDYPDVHLSISCQSDAGNETRTQIDHSSIQFWEVCVGIEHVANIGEEKEK